MSIDELLKPRYKVIASYPNSIFKVGDVFTSVSGKIYCDPESVKFSDYPHLFQPLPWWAERKLKEMPKYVRALDGSIIKAEKWNLDGNFIVLSKGRWYSNVEPATEAEYTAYITQTQQP